MILPMKYKIEKNTVQETLILPLYSRKLCTELYSNPSSGFRILFSCVLRCFFALSVRCIVLFGALWVLAVLLP